MNDVKVSALLNWQESHIDMYIEGMTGCPPNETIYKPTAVGRVSRFNRTLPFA